jgi:hypothetical protein
MMKIKKYKSKLKAMQPTIEEPQTEERLLIYENLAEMQRISQEAQTRADLLNQIRAHGLENEAIQNLTQSLTAIDDFILKRHLSENNELRRLHEAGISAEALLPQALQSLSYRLKALFNYRMPNRTSSKFENLLFTDSWQLDQEAMENQFIKAKAKIYLESEQQIKEFQTLEMFRNYLQEHCPGHLIRDNYFLNTRFEVVGQGRYRIRHTYFQK